MTASPLNILIVEDDLDIREALVEALELGEGYVVRTAGNGQEGLAALDSSSVLPNLILLDLMMPVMDGYQFRATQKQSPVYGSIPVIVMSADGKAQEKLGQLECKEFLRKPLDLDDLIAAIKKLTA